MLRTPAKRKSRDPERTRGRLLKAGFREVYRSGFQGASIDTILTAANVTKGAFYHHFESKEALGHAIIDEVIEALARDRWFLPLQRSEDRDPVDALIEIVQAVPNGPRDVKGGCPLANLAQEMSLLDEEFRRRLATIFHTWQKSVAMALRRGQSEGTVRRDVVPEEAASFLVAMIEGYELLAKNAQDGKVWEVGLGNILRWLQSLRPPRRSGKAVRGTRARRKR